MNDDLKVTGHGKKRVLIVGLDGATWDVILPMMEMERLPVLARLTREGASGELRSTLPPVSPVAWSSFLTGKNPGRHGVFGFEEIARGSYDFRPVTTRPAGHRSLWRIAGGHGRRVIALDIPFSWPPEEVNGYLVAGFGAPTREGTEFTWPASLRTEMAKRFGEFDVAVPGLKAAPPRDEVFRRWDRILDNRARVADFLLREEDWDVFMIVLGVTDHIQHGAWTYYEPLHPDYRAPEAPAAREALFRYYEKADRFIGQLLERAGSSLHAVVLSDHGFGTTRRGDLTRRILVERKWLKYRSLPLVSSAGMMNLLHRLYDASPWLKRLLHRRAAERHRLKQMLARAIEWKQTAAFPAAMGWQIYVNAAGAFPQGTIAPGEPCYALCREIKEALENCGGDDKSLEPIQRVWHRDEAYRGEAVARAPDLLVEYRNLHRCGLSASGAQNVAEAAGDLVGSHAMNGIVILWGPEIQSAAIDNARIEDVMPTILHLAGLPVPDDLDGRVLADALRPAALQSRPVRSEPTNGSGMAEPRETPLASREAESVKEQLRQLGYID